MPATRIWSGRSGSLEQPREPLGLAEEQAGALVRREAPREADREHVRVELSRAARARDEREQPRFAARCAAQITLVVELERALEVAEPVSAEQVLELVARSTSARGRRS